MSSVCRISDFRYLLCVICLFLKWRCEIQKNIHRRMYWLPHLKELNSKTCVCVDWKMVHWTNVLPFQRSQWQTIMVNSTTHMPLKMSEFDSVSIAINKHYRNKNTHAHSPNERKNTEEKWKDKHMHQCWNSRIECCMPVCCLLQFQNDIQ